MTILLIEDDAVEILKFNRSLVKLGEAHELIEAHNGEIALGLLAENSQIDLILLDLNMPKMNFL
jgi:CheY-like chemotaxis protein